MKNTLSGGQLAGGNSTTEREIHDFYATDPQTTKLFLSEIQNEYDFNTEVLEPACGQGHMANVIKEVFPNSTVVATDLIDRGYGIGNVDFITHDYGKTFDIVMT